MLYHNVMPKRLGRHICNLKKLSKANKKQQCIIVKTSDVDFVKCLCECAYNILKGNISINLNEKIVLSKYKNILRKLIDKKISLDQKKKCLITQKGGIIPLIISPILAAIASLAVDLIKQNGE